MRKLIFILALGLFASCNSDDNGGCECYAQYYQFGMKTTKQYYSDNCGDDGKVTANSNNLRIVVECE
mgnify:CR=1 FL=1